MLYVQPWIRRSAPMLRHARQYRWEDVHYDSFVLGIPVAFSETTLCNKSLGGSTNWFTWIEVGVRCVCRNLELAMPRQERKSNGRCYVHSWGLISRNLVGGHQPDHGLTIYILKRVSFHPNCLIAFLYLRKSMVVAGSSWVLKTSSTRMTAELVDNDYNASRFSQSMGLLPCPLLSRA